MVELPPDPNSVYDTSGNKLGTFPLSEQQLEKLQTGTISVFFHTPQMLHATLGIVKGSFKLYVSGNKTTTDTVSEFNRYLELQAAIPAARSA